MHTRVMARRHAVCTDAGSTIDQMVKLYEVVAQNAGARRFAPEIAAHKWSDNGFFELVLEVEHVKRHAEMGGHTTRIPDIVDRAATSGTGDFGLCGFVPTLPSQCASLIPQ